MNTKLTLTMEQNIIEKAKIYAQKKERSLSDLIENYLKTLVLEETNHKEVLSPTVKALKGAFKTQKGLDYTKELTNTLSEKYL